MTLSQGRILDEDLTVAGLLAGRRSEESPQSLKKWLKACQAKKKYAPQIFGLDSRFRGNDMVRRESRRALGVDANYT